MSDAPFVSVQTMRLSDGRADHYVSIKVADRQVHPHMFRDEYKAAYHVALYRWLFSGGEEPARLDFADGDFPAQAKELVGADPVQMRLLEERVEQLEDELDEARNVPWPEWASSILRSLQHYGYDPAVDGEVDLGEAFKDYLEGMCQAEEQDRKRSSEKDAKIIRLGGALQRIASKANALARDPDTHNRGLWQACADEAQTALSPTEAKGVTE